MDPSPKILLVIIFAAVLHTRAYPQVEDTARTLANQADSETSKNPEKAIQLFVEATHLARQSKDWETYVKSVNKLGSIAIEKDKHRNAVFGLLKDALKVSRNFQNADDRALLHFNLGEFYNRLTIQIDTPIFHYKEALNIWRKSKGEWSPEVSDCYHGLGNIYKYYKFDFYQAEKCYEQALLIREKIGFTDSLKLYRNYYSLAATNRSQFDFDKALSYGSKTLEVAKKLEPSRIELAHGMVANIYRDMHNSELAIKHYLTALELNAKTKNLDERAWYYLCLGETFKNDSLFKDALQYFSKAYELYKMPEVKDPDLFLHLLRNMLEPYSRNNDEKNFVKIRNEVFKELALRNSLESEMGSQVWEEVGEHHFRKHAYDSALYCYQQGLKTAVRGFHSQNIKDNPSVEQIGFNYFIHEILTKKAFALQGKFRQTGDHNLMRYSMDCLKHAEKLISLQRNSLDLEVAKWAFLDKRFDLYEKILSTLHEGAQSFHQDTIHQLAFRYLEQSKARSLADALTQAEFSSQITSHDSLFQFLNELKRQLFSTQDLINREIRASSDSPKLSELRETVVQLDRKIQVCKATIEEKHPGYFKAKYGYKYLSITEVQCILKKKEQVLIEFFWGNEFVYAMGIGHDQVIFQKIGKVDSVSATINSVLLHLNDERSLSSIDAFNSFSANGFKLYKTLIGPFRELLKNTSRIQIIPDGRIGQVPFEILLQEKSILTQINYLALNYLVKSYSIGYAYSSSMLVNEDERLLSNPSFLGIGFTGGDTINGTATRLQDIEGARMELNALRSRFQNGEFLTDDRATESNFKSLASDFDIIHLAVHGRSDIQNDFAANLYFTNTANAADDGELHAYELYGLKLKAFMTVLSACESGLGKGYKGEGMISMASAFAFSGCQNTLMSLWKVNDQASINLIDNFYSYFLEGEAIDAALRKSKLNYLASADELTADPKIWAPLVVYGNLDGIQKNDRSSIFVIAGVLAIVVVLLLSFKRLRRTPSVSPF